MFKQYGCVTIVLPRLSRLSTVAIMSALLLATNAVAAKPPKSCTKKWTNDSPSSGHFEYCFKRPNKTTFCSADQSSCDKQLDVERQTPTSESSETTQKNAWGEVIKKEKNQSSGLTEVPGSKDEQSSSTSSNGSPSTSGGTAQPGTSSSSTSSTPVAQETVNVPQQEQQLAKNDSSDQKKKEPVSAEDLAKLAQASDAGHEADRVETQAENLEKNGVGYNVLGQSRYEEARDRKDEDCSLSSDLSDGKMGCKGARTTIEVAKISNQISQMASSAAVTVKGQMNTMEASQKGTQSAMLDAAADTQILGAKMQLTTGGMNAAMGVIQIAQSSVHKNNAKKIRNEITKGVSLNGAKTEAELRAATAGRSLKEKGTESTGDKTDGYASAQGLAGSAISKFNLNDHGELQTVTVTQKEIEALRQTATANAASNPGLAAEQNRRAEALERKRDQEIKLRLEGRATKERLMKSQLSNIGRNAATEQTEVSQAAMQGGMMSFVTGAQQLIQGGFNLAAGKKLKEAAKTLATSENRVNGKELPQMDSFPTDTSTAQQGGAITGNGEAETVAAVGDTTGESDYGDLGQGFNPGGNQDGLKGPAPAAGKFNPGGSNGGGGGGGGGIGGGSTSPASGGGDDEGSSKLADTNKNPAGYESGGSYAGGGGGAAAANAGPDLSALAQLLPKNEEDTPGNSIMDFGGREPASDQPGSFSGRDANLFQNVHDVYQEKQKRKFVGL